MDKAKNKKAGDTTFDKAKNKKAGDTAFDKAKNKKAGDTYATGPKVPTVPTASEVTALAVLRRDGFASLAPPRRAPARGADVNGGGEAIDGSGMAAGVGGKAADGSDEVAIVVTRALNFTRGSWLFVNADATHGEVRVGVLVQQAPPKARCHAMRHASLHDSLQACRLQELEVLSLVRCQPMRGVNATKHRVVWSTPEPSEGPLAALRGQPIHLQFKLHAAQLFSFWVSPSQDGKSGGFMGGGGPGFVGGIDGRRTVSSSRSTTL